MTTIKGLLLAAMALAAGYYVPLPSAGARASSAIQAPATQEKTTSLDFEIQLARGGELVIAPVVSSTRETIVSASYQWVVRGDDGVVIGRPSVPVTAQPDAHGRLARFTTPQLPDGFHSLQLALVFATDDDYSRQIENTLYLEVIDGEPVVIPQEEWRTRSAYMVIDMRIAPSEEIGEGQ